MNRERSYFSLLERLVVFHTTILLLGSAWVYGGNISWMRTALALWASLGAGLTIAAFFQPGQHGSSARRKIVWLAPLALFSALVLFSATNPSFRSIYINGETAFVRGTAAHPAWPSTISPTLTLHAWWFAAGAYLSAFNLVLVIRSRSALRKIMTLIAVNTLVLSVFGTLQKLSGAGFYFGAAESPNSRFFATFIYYNHWAAFMILGLTAAIGLLWHGASRHQGRDLWWHSPFSAVLVGVILMAASAPVSASRSGTIITALVIGVALIHCLASLMRARRERHQKIWPRVLLVLTLSCATTVAVGWLSYDSLGKRYTETRLAMDEKKSLLGGRMDLYRDTWALVMQKPAFGWGLDTYAVSFQLMRPVTVNLRDPSENFYATTHNDWLQSLAETGFVGTGLIVLMGAIPLASLSARRLAHPLTGYPMLGCALVLVYALVEFPFANSAVMITFWILLFTLLRHAELTAGKSRLPK